MFVGLVSEYLIYANIDFINALIKPLNTPVAGCAIKIIRPQSLIYCSKLECLSPTIRRPISEAYFVLS
jgi:hypothetical protein